MVCIRALFGAIGIALRACVFAPAAQAEQTIVGFTSDTFTVHSPDGPASGLNPNRIAVSEDAARQLHVVDTGTNVTVAAESPCFQIGVNEAGCPADPSHTATLSVTAGAGADSVVINLPDKPLAGIAHVEVFGGGGNDFIVGGGGDDTLEGDSRVGGDGLQVPGTPAPAGNDILIGNGGHDTLRGGPLSDYLNGAGLTATDSVSNTLDGGEGADFLDAGNSFGPDHFVGGSGQDEFSSLPHPLFQGLQLQNQVSLDVKGGDTVSYATRIFSGPGTTGVTANLDGTANDGAAGEGDQIDTDVESLVGTVRDDKLTGSSGRNLLQGGLGSDTLSGGAGGDALLFKDGIADHCSTFGPDDFIDADLVDPTPDDCGPRKAPPFGFIFNSQPLDETIPYITIGPKLRRSGVGRMVARVKCPGAAKHSCKGTLSVSGARGGHALATCKYRAAPGRSARVALTPGRADVRKQGVTRL